MSNNRCCTLPYWRLFCQALLSLLVLGAVTASHLQTIQPAPTAKRSVTLIDPSLPELKILLDQLPDDTELVWLDKNTSLADTLANHLSDSASENSTIAELHLLTHGSPGTLQLAHSTVEIGLSASEDRSTWAPLRAILDDSADVFVYACEFGRNAQGQRAVSRLAELTGANVHASSDLTGNAAAGGNWTLEVSAASDGSALTTPSAGLRFNDYTATLEIELTETLDPAILIETVVDTSNTDMVIHSVTVVGNNGQIATFKNGLSVPGFVSFDEGIIISSGQVSDIHGPNADDGTGTDIPNVAGADGDTDFNTLSAAPQGTFDAAYIEISFTPAQNQMQGTFVFASEEYNEYAPPSGSLSSGNTYYDAMAFFVNGVNYSVTAAGDAVSINTVNESRNAADFHSNDREDDGIPTPFNIAPDGFTRKLVWAAPVNPGVPNTLKFGVADGGDASFDSWLMIDKYSFAVLEAPAQVDLALEKTDRHSTIAVGQTLDYQFTLTNDGLNATGREIQITDTLPTGITVNGGQAEALQELGINADEWTCQSDASTPQTVTCSSMVSLDNSNGNNTTVVAFRTDPVPPAAVNTTLTNTATVTTSDIDTDNANDFDTDTTLVTSADTSAPTLEWQGLPALVADNSPIIIELSFNENISGLTLGDFALANASLSDLITIDAATYTLQVTPDETGDISISLPANSVQDSAGNGNSSATAPVVLFDATAIALVLQNVPGVRPDTTSYPVTFDFSAAVSGFDISDISVINGAAGNFVTNSSSSYTADITPDGTGDITITIPAQAATALSGPAQSQSATATTIYNISAPTVTIGGAPAVVNTTATYSVSVGFSEIVSTFDVSDVNITNATLANFQTIDGGNYTVDVTPSGAGDITLYIASDSAIDIAGNGNAPSATVFTFYDIDGPVPLLANLPVRVNSTSSFTIEIQFDEPVTGFSLSDFSVTNGAVSNLAAQADNSYTVDVAPNGSGDLTVQLQPGIVSDFIGNANSLAATALIVFDNTPPQLFIEALTGDDIINAIEDNSPQTVSGTSTGLENNQIVSVSLNGKTYATPVSSGIWSVSIPANDLQALAATENLTLEATDLAGNAATTVSVVIEHDTTAPANPTVASVLTNSASPTLTGTATINTGDTLQVNVDDIIYTAGDGHLIDNTDGTWTLNIPSSQILDEQIFEIIATVTDAAGNAASDNSTLELEVDTTAPTTPTLVPDLSNADDTGSSDTDNITAQTQPAFSIAPGTLTPGNQITVFANGAIVATSTVLPNGDFSSPVSTLSDGAYAIRYSVTDDAGNTSALSPTLTMTIDTATDAPTIASPVAGDNIVNQSEYTDVIATGTAEPNSTISLEFSDGANAETVTVSTDVSGMWTLVANPADLSSLADGQVTLLATATDPAGNSNDSLPFNITLDAIAPDTPTVSTLASSTTSPVVTGTANTEIGGSLVVSIDGVDYAASGSDLTDNGNGTWSLAIPVANALSQATYDVQVTNTDAAGNTTQDNSVDELTIDTTAPAVASVDVVLSNSNLPLLTGLATLVTGEELAVTIDGVTYAQSGSDLTVDGAGNWMLQIPVGAEIADGTYSVNAEVSDAAGNTSVDTTTNEVTVDTVAPSTPAITAQVTRDTTPQINGTAIIGASETLTVSIDGESYSVGDGNLVDNGDGTWTLTVPADHALAEATFSIVATITDAANNTSSTTENSALIVDLTAPQTPATALDMLTSDDTGSSDTDNLTQISRPTVGVAAGQSEPDLVTTVYINGGTPTITTAASDGSFSTLLPALADGSHELRYTQTDAAGNESALSPALTISIDGTTLDPEINTPIESDDVINLSEQTDVLVVGLAEAGASVLISISDGVNAAVNRTVTAASSGVWTTSGVEFDVSALNSGSLTVTAIATDTAGNSAAAPPVAVTLNIAAPSITINAIAGDNIINAVEDDSDVILSGTTADVEDGQSVALMLNGKSYSAIVGSNTWSTILPAQDAQVLPGSNSVTANVSNGSGNVAVQVSASIIHDALAPELSVDVIATDNLINASEDNSPVIISGTSTGLEDGQLVSISLNGFLYTATVASNIWTTTIPSVDIQALPTTNNLDIDAVDLAGNPAVTLSTQIIHDTLAPSVAIYPLAVANGANASAYSLYGTCTSGDETVNVSVQFASPASRNVLCNADGEWNATFDVSGIADNVNAITVNANQDDAAGNTGVASTQQADKDTSIPSISIAIIATDDYINALEDDSAVTISGSSTDIEDGQTISVTLNAIVYTTAVAADSWSVTVPQADVAALPASNTVSADGQNLAATPAATATRALAHDATPPSTPAVTVLTTNSSTPVISGSATLTPGDTLEVTVNGEVYTAGDGNLIDHEDGTWTLTIPSGDALSAGSYDVTVSITDIAGNTTSEATSNELEIDQTAPAAGAVAPDLVLVSDTGASDSDDITALVSVTFFVPAGTLDADDTVTVYADGIEIGTGVVVVDGSFSSNASLPGDGVHQITYTTTDPAGNTSAVSPALSITLDTTIAAPVLTTPVENDDRVNAVEQSDVLAEGTAENDSSVTVEFDDGNNPAITAVATANALGVWTLLGSEADLTALDEGTITITVSAEDTAGNSSELITHDVLLDSIAPAQPVVNAQIGNTSVPQISGTVASVAGDILSVELNGFTYVADTGALVDNGDGTWELTLPATDALADGVYDVLAQLTDAAGNSTTDNTSSELEVDTSQPDTPTVDKQVVASSLPVITGTMTLNAGETLAVTVNSVTYAIGADLVDNGNDTWTLTIPVGDEIADGLLDVVVTVTDAAGNLSTDSSNDELIVDTTFPATPVVNALISNNANPAVSGTAILQAGETLTVGVNAQSYTPEDSALSLAPDGSWTLTIPGIDALPDGTYDVLTTVTDSAGNASSDNTSDELEIDTTAPAVPVVTPLITNTTTPTVEGTVSLALGEQFSVTLAGITYAGTGPELTNNGNGTWTLIVPGSNALSQATYDVNVAVIDPAGNITTDTGSAELTVDTQAPGIPTINALITNTTQPIITGTLTPAANETLSVAVNGDIYFVGSELVISDSNWTLSIPAGQPVPEGVYNVVATVEDAATNISADVTTDELTIDTSVPTISVNSLTTDNMINADEDDSVQTLSGSTSGVEDGQAVIVSLNSIIYIAGVTSDSWSVDIPAEDLLALPDNSALTADVNDIAGNTAVTATATIDHDSIIPRVAFIATPTVTQSNVSAYTVVGMCSINDGDVQVTTSAGTPVTQVALCDADGEWQATINMSGVPEGNAVASIGAVQTDAAGNTSLPSAASIDKDTVSPTLTITDNDTGGDNIINGSEAGSIQITGTTTGVEDFQFVQLTFDDGADPMVINTQVVGNSWTTELVSLLALQEGALTLTALVNDAAGNPAPSVVDNLQLDVTWPLLSANDYGPDIDSFPVLTGTTDLPDASSVSIAANNVLCIAAVSAGQWSCQSTVELDSGTTQLTAEAADVAGNTTSTGFTATIDLTLDSDGDGILDIDEGDGDSDNDGTADKFDTDADNDGIDDALETADDTDGDGVPNYLDLDADNDGVADQVEGSLDSDNDSIANYLDLDADNDGLSDLVESGTNQSLDTNSDGRLDGAVGVNGLLDAIETSPDSAVIDYDGDTNADLPLDTDSDSVADYLDLDSDNDGVADTLEAGGSVDASTSGINGFTDNNGDGFHDPLAFEPLPDTASGINGAVDRLSLDSDEDGIPDYVEAGGLDTDLDGLVDGFTDANSNGFDDSLEITPLVDDDTDADGLANRLDEDSDDDGIDDLTEGNIDTDNDGLANYIDTDSDGDNLLDIDEGTVDLDGDSTPDYIDSNLNQDTDGDGILDSLEGSGDADGDGTLNFLDTDADGDGIPDNVETNVDTDNDGVPDFLDLDADNDGIPDSLETADDLDGDLIANFQDTDSDGDGIVDTLEAGPSPATPLDSDGDGNADYLDSDADDDGIDDQFEGSVDTDNDGIADYLDNDSDGDTLPDSVEGGLDSDADGTVDSKDLDSDNDGILDSIETAADTDNDGIANYIDDDSDNDNIDDATEGNIDSDGDSLPDYLDPDSDNDLILDAQEGVNDSDGDSTPNYLDIDSDGDGIPDAMELGPVAALPLDTDNDSIPDYLDNDSDADGIADSVEGSVDNDGDGIPGYIDTDSDGDGIPDVVEAGDGPTPVDTDGDGAPDYLDLDSDADGVNDIVEAGITPATPRDRDADGTPDYLDFDSDNDGISDLIEGSIDSDGDGIPDHNDNDSDGDGLPDLDAGPDDEDGDGIPNYLDSDIDGDGIANTTEGMLDTDGDGLLNYRDTDSDGDGIPDAVEQLGDIDGDGLQNLVDTDSDGDGIPDEAEAGEEPLEPTDSDADGFADYLDTDSDNDLIPDLVEGGADTDTDGLADYLDTDADGDGIDDLIEGIVDTDQDDLPDYLDTDSDNDGLGDELEGNTDSDFDATPDFRDLDSDNDLISDALEGSMDTDSDGLPDYLDTDSDADGIPDSHETFDDADGDGAANHVDLDADGDGINDSVEAGSDPTHPLDTDLDGIPDFLDLDSDNDGIPDASEGGLDSDGDGIPDVRDEDSNNDGIPDSVAGADDDDGDGIANFLDGDIDNDGIGNLADGLGDADGDSIPNYADTDSDGDQIDDFIEGQVDTDGDGLANFLDTDADGDLILDIDEAAGGNGTIDTDEDGIADYLDTDSDGDSISDRIEGVEDTDNDTVPDYLDPDADGDGIADHIETALDTDEDGVENFRDTDADGDGIADATESGLAGPGGVLLDSDLDNIFDYLDRDSDGDGIDDAVETDGDTDLDGQPDYLDTDSDADGIADSLEQADDVDGDGLGNAVDTDADGDGIDDAVEGASDSDGDGVANFIDADADGDGIPDLIEGNIDSDGDNVPDYLDVDSDSDGVSDLVEAGDDPNNPVDSDADGTPDYLDLDSNGDGIPDLVEGSDDLDGDGISNFRDLDDNNDGIPDGVLGEGDTDGDGVADYIDNDIDGDGLGNSDEGMGDHDGDGTPNYLDLDSDGDGIGDALEANTDRDGDGLPNYLDVDADGDGIGDAIEGQSDTDNDGAPDYLDSDSDGDLIPDTIEGNSDSDGDGTPDYQDRDSDDDGIPDLFEGTVDTDGDGIADSLDHDSDGDGINDFVEAGPNGELPIDTDGDGLPDFRSLDSDGDGIPDSEENVIDSDGDGIIDAVDTDSNNDGIPDADLGNGDLDEDGIPDYLDGDIDGDGLSNVIESSADTDNDGTPNYADLDSDDDGLPDAGEGTQDTDADGAPNYLDADSDNDGIPDATENLFDSDFDGQPDALDLDSDNDGIPDQVEGLNDTDLDTIPAYLDLDSDNDAIPDAVERAIDSDEDGIQDFLDTDSDNDTLPDVIEGSVDTDGDGVANYLDNDSDDDLIDDSIEGAGDFDGDDLPDFVDADSDNDGIADVVETATDTDADGTANFRDADSDGDGISDLLETGSDTDADGIPNSIDEDADGDGIPDSIESGNAGGTPADFDLDGTPDYLDTDSDDDGILDSAEGSLDADSDGIANYLDNDADDDGISDARETDADADEDGVPNYLDLDSDGDGVLDQDESTLDTDGDDLPDYLDTDADGDGIPDSAEGTGDTDSDGLPNYRDTDSDNDGIADAAEAGFDALDPIDTDADGVADFLDSDADGDGIADATEGTSDSDADGAPDYLDTDSDNDGVPDLIEGVIDTDGDGAADFVDNDADGDGITDNVEAGADPQSPVDTDEDGLPDYRDTDSDADGILDADEGVIDSDGDSVVDSLDSDSNNDGIPDSLVGNGDADNDGIANHLDADIDGDGISNTSETIADTDGDGQPNFFDTDSDDDGIPDSLELVGDADGDGQPDYLDTDSDNDGILDALEGTVDSDGDGTADYLDDDADGDSVPDVIEGASDLDEDGIPNYLDTDADGDGLNDAIEGSEDPDADGSPSFLDLDADGDGIGDAIETAIDTDGDSIPDYLDGDSDGDGIADSQEGALDTDGDFTPDYIDEDADNDGIPDAVEQNTDSDGDGVPDFQDIDSDNDGINDSVEAGTDGTTPVDSDGDGTPDYQDNDSDNDGIADAEEGHDDADGDGIPDSIDPDANNDGIPDNLIGSGDTDGDGINDTLDADIDGDGLSNTAEGTGDSDADGIPDFADTDSDGDTLPDALEGSNDTDGDGIADYLDIDSDNDGIDDAVEGSDDIDGDLIPAYLDADSDGDGIPDLTEGDVDTDADGTADYLDLDADGDTIHDSTELTGDVDNDGIPNYLDLDADGDGIDDSSELAGDADGDGLPNFLDTDSDDDGLPDSLEGAQDSDGDGLADYVDPDSDNDSIADSVESSSDTDLDGVADYLDTDSDDDGLPDSLEGAIDSDEDGVANFRDSDADGDGIPDSVEGSDDSDLDGSADFLDTDADGDGINDSVEAGSNPELPVDTDGDSIPDYLDSDSDGDGQSDNLEGNSDSDGDGVPDALDEDSNNDGIPDSELDGSDDDGDGIPDFLDDDLDNDGIPNADEQALDSDGDGLLNYVDTDSDNDGLPDSVEGIGDTDGDSIPDFLDTDSDGDGIADELEHGDDALTPTDTDNDSIPDYLDSDSDGDGINDGIEGMADSDNDGLHDLVDTDSDNDGIPDAIEGNVDTDGDGAPDYIDLDADGDGINDNVEAGSDATDPEDSDGDSVPDYLDIDSDNDGVGDNGDNVLDSDGDGIADTLDPDANNDGITDSLISEGDLDGDGIANKNDGDIDGDGIVNAAESSEDTDNDGIPNFLDTDSDGDGIEDSIEGSGDIDGDGLPDYLDTDSDGDGLDDSLETSADTDFDGVPNYQDTDADNDGIPDSLEGNLDSDFDGLVDFRDPDADNDGIADADEGLADPDQDGIPAYLDTDSDDDGITDSTEGGLDADGDGVPNFLDPDADADGIPDAQETNIDTDSDGIPNYLDTDSDNDNLPDSVEGTDDADGDGVPDYIGLPSDMDTDGDGILDSVEGRGDADGDGLANFEDDDADGDGIPDRLETTRDLDGDGIANYLDLDSDNDGITDLIETSQDHDLDNVSNAYDLDSDNDGLPDSVEAQVNDANADGEIDGFTDANANGLHDALEGAVSSVPDTDQDLVPDFLDTDSDQDGIPDLVEAAGGSELGYTRVTDLIDTDNNGLDDSLQAIPLSPLDSDGDGIADFLEIDSDDDGISDLLETGGEDNNGDGRVDALSDLDNDGIPDSVDVDFTAGEDKDNDGIDDSADVDYFFGDDQDGDGIIDSRDPDRDGDGFIDSAIDEPDLSSALPDANGSGTPDYQEATDAPVGIGLSGSGAGCTIGGQSSDPTLPLLILLSILMLIRRSVHRIGPRAIATLVVISSCLWSSNSLAQAIETGFQARNYVAAGFGGSTLKPDTEGTRWDVDSGDGTGMQFAFGRDLRRHISMELHFASLGDAVLQQRLTPFDKEPVAYQTVGLSALYYLGRNHTLNQRQGVSAFLRTGIGMLSVSSEVNYEQQNNIHVLLGLGAEFATYKGLGLRAEFISFDSDIQYAQLGLLYRFGSNSGNFDRPKPDIVAIPAPTQKATDQATDQATTVTNDKPALPPVAATETVQPGIAPAIKILAPKRSSAMDSDGDGVFDATDLCPGSIPRQPVDTHGCLMFTGVLSGVNFVTGSAELKQQSISILENVAAQMILYPELQVEISAHTDDVGNADYNLTLSKRRVVTVGRFLLERGIAKTRFQLKAFGERRPLVPNDSDANRAKNRRVEFTIRSGN